jgi:2-polyprenyl-6-methoxyphenol hydroxylase-like FAD-dependent oxidoreductase
MLSLPNFIKQAYGPGWALVGDADHHKDPLVARGISDAFRDAELLAQALECGLRGTVAELTTQLVRYQRARDDANADVYEANLSSAAWTAQSPSCRRRLAGLQRQKRSPT